MTVLGLVDAIAVVWGLGLYPALYWFVHTHDDEIGQWTSDPKLGAAYAILVTESVAITWPAWVIWTIRVNRRRLR